MDDKWLAERFEADRTRLQAVAYRLIGSTSEAEVRFRRDDVPERGDGIPVGPDYGCFPLGGRQLAAAHEELARRPGVMAEGIQQSIIHEVILLQTSSPARD